MKTKYFPGIFLLLLFLMAFVAVGCSGQKSTTEKSEEVGDAEALYEKPVVEPVPEPEPESPPEPPKEVEVAAKPAQAPKPAVTTKPEPTTKPVAAPKVETPPVAETTAKTEAAPAAESPAKLEPAAETEASPKTESAALPEPAPEPIPVTVPAGTIMEISFLDPLSSKTSQAGQAFRTNITQDIVLLDKVVIPAGSIISGTVTEAVPLKKIGGKAKLALDFSALELTTGEVAPIKASFMEEGKSETKKDTATIGGATAGGAILGRILSKKDKKKGTIIGAIIGAAAGTVIASKTEGEEVEIPVGTPMSLQLTEPVVVAVSP